MPWWVKRADDEACFFFSGARPVKAGGCRSFFGLIAQASNYCSMKVWYSSASSLRLRIHRPSSTVSSMAKAKP